MGSRYAEWSLSVEAGMQKMSAAIVVTSPREGACEPTNGCVVAAAGSHFAEETVGIRTVPSPQSIFRLQVLIQLLIQFLIQLHFHPNIRSLASMKFLFTLLSLSILAAAEASGTAPSSLHPPPAC